MAKRDELIRFRVTSVERAKYLEAAGSERGLSTLIRTALNEHIAAARFRERQPATTPPTPSEPLGPQSRRRQDAAGRGKVKKGVAVGRGEAPTAPPGPNVAVAEAQVEIDQPPKDPPVAPCPDEKSHGGHLWAGTEGYGLGTQTRWCAGVKCPHPNCDEAQRDLRRWADEIEELRRIASRAVSDV